MITARSSRRIRAKIRVNNQEKQIVINPDRAETAKRVAQNFVDDFKDGVVSEYKVQILCVYIKLVLRDIECGAKIHFEK